jgi:hypothetical protein
MKGKLLFVSTILFAILALWNTLAVSHVFFGYAGALICAVVTGFVAIIWPNLFAITSRSFFTIVAILSALAILFIPPNWYGWATGLAAILLLLFLRAVHKRLEGEETHYTNVHPIAEHPW